MYYGPLRVAPEFSIGGVMAATCRRGSEYESRKKNVCEPDCQQCHPDEEIDADVVAKMKIPVGAPCLYDEEQVDEQGEE